MDESTRNVSAVYKPILDKSGSSGLKKAAGLIEEEL
jgi:hypothetical protein